MTEQPSREVYDRACALIKTSPYTIGGIVHTSGNTVVIASEFTTSVGLKEMQKEFKNVWFSKVIGGFVVSE